MKVFAPGHRVVCLHEGTHLLCHHTHMQPHVAVQRRCWRLMYFNKIYFFSSPQKSLIPVEQQRPLLSNRVNVMPALFCHLCGPDNVQTSAQTQADQKAQIGEDRTDLSIRWNSARSAGHGANSQGMRAPLCLTIKPPSQHPPLHQMSTPLPRPSVCFPLSLNSCSL